MKESLKKPLQMVLLGIFSIAAIGLILFVTKKNGNKRCRGIEINLSDKTEQGLVKKTDIEKLITNFGNDPFDGKIIANIKLSEIEKRVFRSGLVKSTEAYINTQGYLVIDAQVYQPIARILGTNQKADRYLDIEGSVFPVSKHFTPKVLLLSGSFFDAQKDLKAAKNQDLMTLIGRVSEDPFWEAQITEMHINSFKDITLLPLVGDNQIEFGKPEHIETKLKKLLIFYRQILPQKEWGNFKKISVKYDGQIVCN
jgi:cell division protein FtsQ